MRERAAGGDGRVALEAGNNNNPFLRDVCLWDDWDGDGCREEDVRARGALVMMLELV